MDGDPLEVDTETMRRLGHLTVDWLVDRAARRREEPALLQATPEEMARRVPAAAPSGGERFEEILEHLAEEVLPYRSRIDHPRYLTIPKVGMSISPYLMAACLKPVVRRILDEGFDFDLIDAHYFFPDGVAAVMLGEYFKKPVVVTSRGSDISVIAGHKVPRKLISRAADKAAGLITVCEALKDAMVRLRRVRVQGSEGQDFHLSVGLRWFAGTIRTSGWTTGTRCCRACPLRAGRPAGAGSLR